MHCSRTPTPAAPLLLLRLLRARVGALLCVSGLLGLLAVPGGMSAQSVDPATWRVDAPPPAGYDREWAAAETWASLEALIRIDTQNPPGNELEAALWFEAYFRDLEGVEIHVHETTAGRANVVARLRAVEPELAPVIVMGHLDVVGADPESWSTPPFEPTVRGDYLYGRGTIDDKGMLAAAATAFRLLARDREALRRDVIFLGTADEEAGGSEGIDALLAERPELISDAEFAINEGGRIRVVDGRIRTVNIQTVEKVPYNVVARAGGPSGHGSVPLPENALAALARAASRVHDWRPPVRLNETTRLYFQRLAEVESDPEMRRAMEGIAGATDAAEIDSHAVVLARDPLHNAVLRTGASLTILDGGFRSNVIPSEGTATFNVRILPEEDIEEVVREMQRVGGEPSVTFTLSGAPAEQVPAASPVDTDLFRAMEGVANTMAPDAVVMPFMSTGATDAQATRAAGIPTYGILPMPLPMEDELRMHGDDERVPIPALGWATEYLYRVLGEVVW
ncbi:MAG: M20/M25/M40 family metallo-hydrolase [Gemmatimonadales bacterium]|nr:MAG: M20/M25/M40 family metallo-hydrolase [Gemmatimonadales bacterium]